MKNFFFSAFNLRFKLKLGFCIGKSIVRHFLCERIYKNWLIWDCAGVDEGVCFGYGFKWFSFECTENMEFSLWNIICQLFFFTELKAIFIRNEILLKLLSIFIRLNIIWTKKKKFKRWCWVTCLSLQSFLCLKNVGIFYRGQVSLIFKVIY